MNNKYFRVLTLAQKAALPKHKLAEYTKQLGCKKKTYTGKYVSKKQYRKYLAYINSVAWKKKREEAFEFHGRNCGKCGSRYFLQIHHKTYINLYHEPMSDLMVLCDECHKDTHKPGRKKKV
jgi:5-methylcytosine-specific restriction endonuclease McrA